MPIDFANFDQRHYPVVSTRDGYGEWADSYEATVPDEMDIRLLARLTPENWKNITAAADLGCGTGRIGGWLKSNGVTTIDGIDLTPEMLKLARVKNVYRTLREGDVSRTAFADASYDLAIASLMDEHIRDLATLYREAARLLTPNGRFVLVGYHPMFIMSTGMPTHFQRASGVSIAIETHVHLLSDHFKAAAAAGMTMREFEEGVIDDDWLARKPKWSAHRGKPVSFVMVFAAGRVSCALPPISSM